MKSSSLAFLALGLICGWAASGSAQVTEILRVQGSVSAAIPVAEAARTLRSERNMDVRIVTSGGSPSAIGGLGEGGADIALSTRPVTQEERASYPSVVFNEIPFGAQSLALIVSKDVWEGGVRSLTTEQVRGIYEERIKNWKEVGGPDTKIVVFMTTPGRGMWEMFAQWLYGEVKKAPVKKFATVNNYDEIRNAVEFRQGSFSQIPTPCVDNRVVFALAIRDERGDLIEANRENFISGRYPLCRKLLMITNDRPTLAIKVLVDFMLSERGQKIVKDASLLTLAEVTPD